MTLTFRAQTGMKFQKKVFFVHLPLTHAVKDLIRKLLDPDPTKRISSEQILNHPWMHKYNENSINVELFKENLKSYNSKRRLKRVQLVAYASSVLKNLKK